MSLATSGTTGAARAVVRSTASWTDSFTHVSALTGIGAGARVWVPGPLTASMNLFAAVHAHHSGAAWSPSPEGATHASLTPALLARHLGRLRGLVVVVAGDRLPVALRDRARDNGVTVTHYYGAAELSFVAWGSCAEDLTAFPGVEVAVRAGEIWVRSRYLAHGYDGRPGALRRDEDGFATVGDRGCIRAGSLVVQGRPDTVSTAGVTVPVADVEPVLCGAAQGDVVVVGIPHDELGAVLAAVLTDASDLAAVRAAARPLGTCRPRMWFHLAELPLDAGGKVDRAAVVDALTDAGSTGSPTRTGRRLS